MRLKEVLRSLALVTAVATALVAAPSAANAQVAAGSPTARFGEQAATDNTTSSSLHIAQLCAVTTEDVGTDEIYVQKNGSTVWGPRSMNQGTCTRNIFVNVEHGDVIKLYDQDGFGWDPDDWLGTVTIRSTGEYHFTGDGAFYKMWTEN